MLFGEAAEACAVSQPALSMQISELEDVLEVSLVERRKSGVELTEQGEEIARRGRTILASVRDLLDYAKQRWRWRARCMIARTSACSTFRHLSPNARSGSLGARRRRARPTFHAFAALLKDAAQHRVKS